MLFTWDTTDLCVVFRWWHVRGPWSLLFTLLGVVALGMSYELLRNVARKFDDSGFGSLRLDSPGYDSDDDRGRRSPSVTTGKYVPRASFYDEMLISRSGRRRHIVKAVLYGLQVFYSYLLMLVAMTYQVFFCESWVDCRGMFLSQSGLVRHWDSISFMMTKLLVKGTWRVIDFIVWIPGCMYRVYKWINLATQTRAELSYIQAS
jgi:hypothetical protein